MSDAGDAGASDTSAADDEAAATAAMGALLARAEAQADFSEADFASSDSAPHTRREKWQRRTATGAILSGLALGFQQVFEAPKEDIAIIMETSGTPPRDLPVEAEFDGMVPRRSVVKIRPWLLPEQSTPPETIEETAEDEPATATGPEGTAGSEPAATAEGPESTVRPAGPAAQAAPADHREEG
jgi:hypothetical protein